MTSTPLPEQKLRLFKVEYVSQSSGQLVEGYFMVRSLAELDENIADITEIYPLEYTILEDV